MARNQGVPHRPDAWATESARLFGAGVFGVLLGVLDEGGGDFVAGGGAVGFGGVGGDEDGEAAFGGEPGGGEPHGVAAGVGERGAAGPGTLQAGPAHDVIGALRAGLGVGGEGVEFAERGVGDERLGGGLGFGFAFGGSIRFWGGFCLRFGAEVDGGEFGPIGEGHVDCAGGADGGRVVGLRAGLDGFAVFGVASGLIGRGVGFAGGAGGAEAGGGDAEGCEELGAHEVLP